MIYSTIKTLDGCTYRLSKREKEWLNASKDIDAALACIRYALLYARKETKWLLDGCSPDVEYRSQIVDNVHIGLDEVRQIFSDRLSDPNYFPETGNIPLIELARMPDGCPCGVLHQRRGRFDNGIGRPYFWMIFANNAEGKIIRMMSGYHPSSLSLEPSGVFPGINPTRFRQENEKKPAALPAGVPLQFLFVYSKHANNWLSSAEAAKEALHYFNLATFETIQLNLDPTKASDFAWLYERSIFTLPHLHILSRGENVLRLDGPFDNEQLMQELYLRFYPPGGTKVEPEIVKDLLSHDTVGMSVTGKILWQYYCDPDRIAEIIAAFEGNNPLAAQRAAYVLDRLSVIKKDIIQPYKQLLLDTRYDDPNYARQRHVARMLPRLNLNGSEVKNAEQLLLNLSWQQKDAALQIFSLKSIRHFAKTNFRLREFAGPFVYDLMRHARNGRVVREAEITLDTIEYFEEKVHEQWDRQMARA